MLDMEESAQPKPADPSEPELSSDPPKGAGTNADGWRPYTLGKLLGEAAEAAAGRSDFSDRNWAGSTTPERSILVDRDGYILVGPSAPSGGSECSILDRDNYILDRDDYIRHAPERSIWSVTQRYILVDRDDYKKYNGICLMAQKPSTS